MLKTLIKKQFFECFRMYFVNQKTNKKRSKIGIVGFFILFVVIMGSLSSIFYGMAILLGNSFFEAGLNWLYFALMGMTAVVIGVFGSVFNTFSMLYISKDNDLLLAMPIKPSVILASRMSLVYGLSILYSGVVWIPTVIIGVAKGGFSLKTLVFDILLLFIISIFVTVITCILGFVIAVISKRIKNKSLITVIISVGFFLAYYYVCLRLSNIMKLLATHGDIIGKSIKKWANFIYLLGMGAAGDSFGFVAFTVVSIALFAVCYYVLSATFSKIVTRSEKQAKTNVKVTVSKAKSVKKALFNRELKRFFSSPIYILNCSFGGMILLVIAVFSIIKRAVILSSIDKITAELPSAKPLVPLVALFIACMTNAANTVSTPSVSLEGKHLWILKSLPVSGGEILQSKLNLHIALNSVPTVIAVAIISLSLGNELYMAVLSAVLAFVYIRVTGIIGLIIGLKRPNFNWTNEAEPIKQSLNVLASILIGWVLGVLICGGYYFLKTRIEVDYYLVALIVVLTVACNYANRYIVGKGSKLFENL